MEKQRDHAIITKYYEELYAHCLKLKTFYERFCDETTDEILYRRYSAVETTDEIFYQRFSAVVTGPSDSTSETVAFLATLSLFIPI